MRSTKKKRKISTNNRRAKNTPNTMIQPKKNKKKQKKTKKTKH